MKRTLLLLILIRCITITNAQVAVNIPFVTNRIIDAKPIELKKLDISVLVVENVATTTFEMQFYNGNGQVMEGEFNFPLADGITVSNFALDINGEMREGVVVEKAKATQAYEAINRRNVDPGLVEVTQGNNFKARIYPIPANGYKKVIISFEQVLQGDDEDYLYQLPLNIENELEHFSTKVEVVTNRPKPIKSEHPLINMNFTEIRNSYISEYSAQNIKLEAKLAFVIPKQQKTKKVVTYRGKQSPDNYFYINTNFEPEAREKSKPNKLTVIWDESASGTKRDFKREIEILERYVKWVGNSQIQLVTFSNTIHLEKKFTAKNGNCEELIQQLRNTQFDGATNFGAIDFSRFNGEEILLFSDGISNFGGELLENFKNKIIVINTSGISDHNLLNKIANSSSGKYINASLFTDDKIAEILQTEQKQFLGALYDSERIYDLYQDLGTLNEGIFSCAGKAEGATNTITLNFGFNNEITNSKTITIDNSQRLDYSIGERIWAQKKLQHLLINGNEKEIINHGKRYNLVSPQTSLIVLDEVSDYVQYDIVPPSSLRDEFDQLKAQKAKDEGESYLSRMNRLCLNFKADIQWWESVEDCRNKQKPSKNKKEEVIIEEEAEMEEVASVAYSMAEPPPVTEQLNIVEDDVELSEELDIEDSDESNTRYSSTVKINKWESDAEYMTEMKAVEPEDYYKQYLILKAANSKNPSFYFDIATYMFQKNQRKDGLRVISNLAELELENSELLRSLGRVLCQNKFSDEAIFIFERVLDLRPFEPHSFIDLGLAYNELGNYQLAINYLYKVIENRWDFDINSRFPGIELIVIHDINSIIYRHKGEVDFSNIQECFIKNMPVDIRIVIDWNANETDIDLHIVDPWEETCSYQNKRTAIGGKISNDITQGYGPEEFRLKYAIEGEYEIKVHFYGTSKQTLIDDVTVRAFVYTNFGTTDEKKQNLTLQLEPKEKGMYSVGTIEFKK